MTQHTIVQHSGYGYGGKPSFRHAVESRQVNSAAVAKEILARGGLVFPGYLEAEEYCDTENYRAEVTGLNPHAPGGFDDYLVDGLRVYLPASGYEPTEDTAEEGTHGSVDAADHHPAGADPARSVAATPAVAFIAALILTLATIWSAHTGAAPAHQLHYRLDAAARHTLARTTLSWDGRWEWTQGRYCFEAYNWHPGGVRVTSKVGAGGVVRPEQYALICAGIGMVGHSYQPWVEAIS